MGWKWHYWLKGGVIGLTAGILSALIIYIFLIYLFPPLPTCQGEECLGRFAEGMIQLLACFGSIILIPIIFIGISLLIKKKEVVSKIMLLGGIFYLIILVVLLTLEFFLSFNFLAYYFYFILILSISSILTILIFIIKKIVIYSRK